jgi:hypothetical protein
MPANHRTRHRQPNCPQADFTRSRLHAPNASEIFLVGDVFHPFNEPPIESFLDRNVRHASRGGRAMPVSSAWRTPDDVTRPDFDDRFPLALGPSTPGGNYQSLPQGMCMPGAARAWLECHTRARNAGRGRGRVKRVNPYITDEIFRGPLLRCLRPNALQLHGDLLSAAVAIRRTLGQTSDSNFRLHHDTGSYARPQTSRAPAAPFNHFGASSPYQ